MKTIAAGKYYDRYGEEHDLVVHRDEHGKFFIRIDGIIVHKRLSAVEAVNWFAGVFLKAKEAV